MSSSAVSCIRIVSLPMEYQTQSGTIDLVENVLQLGKVASVRIAENFAANSVRYASAFVDFDLTADYAVDLFNQLEMTNGSIALECDVPISWTNGKPMAHIAIRRANNGSSVVQKQQDQIPRKELEVDSWMSIYIPMIPEDMMVASGTCYNSFLIGDLQSCIENKLRLGKIKRVDFVARQQDERVIQSAFVHFDHWYDLPYANKVRDCMNADGVYRQKGFMSDGKFSSFMAFRDDGEIIPRFLTFKINHKPIPDVKPEMNVEQYAAANDALTKSLLEKEAKIAELLSMLKANSQISEDGKGEMTVAELM